MHFVSGRAARWNSRVLKPTLLASILLASILLAACSGDDSNVKPSAASTLVESSLARIEISITSDTDLDHELGELADRTRHLSFDGMGSQLVARRLDGVSLRLEGGARPESLTSCVLEVDPREAERFGESPPSVGFGDVRSAPASGSITLSDSAAALLDATVGAKVASSDVTWHVENILPLSDVVGSCAGAVSPGTVHDLTTPANQSADRRAVGVVWIEVRDGASSRVLVDQLTSALRGSFPSVELKSVTVSRG